jgi:hypothetical protein
MAVSGDLLRRKRKHSVYQTGAKAHLFPRTLQG